MRQMLLLFHFIGMETEAGRDLITGLSFRAGISPQAGCSEPVVLTIGPYVKPL